jgi:hypothetical protein
MKKRLTLALAAGALVAAMLPGVAAAAADGGNSANAKACQKGGWESLQTGTGGVFSNADDCVSYAAKGGALFKPELSFHCQWAAYPGFGNSTGIWWTATGFTPDSTAVAHTSAAGSFEYQWGGVAIDADGASAFSWDQPYWGRYPALAAAYPYSATFAELTDENGVHASLNANASSC